MQMPAMVLEYGVGGVWRLLSEENGKAQSLVTKECLGLKHATTKLSPIMPHKKRDGPSSINDFPTDRIHVGKAFRDFRKDVHLSISFWLAWMLLTAAEKKTPSCPYFDFVSESFWTDLRQHMVLSVMTGGRFRNNFTPSV